MRMIREEVECSACGAKKGTFVYSEVTDKWYCLRHPVAEMIRKLDHNPPEVTR